MHFKQKLTYMALGGLLVLAGYILASLANDSVAQSGTEDVTFGEITCRGLTVVDGEGKRGVRLWINEYGGRVKTFGKDGGSATLQISWDGGVIAVKGNDGGYALLSTNEHGGIVAASGKDGGQASLSNDKYGGVVTARNKHGGIASLGNN